MILSSRPRLGGKKNAFYNSLETLHPSLYHNKTYNLIFLRDFSAFSLEAGSKTFPSMNTLCYREIEYFVNFIPLKTRYLLRPKKTAMLRARIHHLFYIDHGIIVRVISPLCMTLVNYLFDLCNKLSPRNSWISSTHLFAAEHSLSCLMFSRASKCLILSRPLSILIYSQKSWQGLTIKTRWTVLCGSSLRGAVRLGLQLKTRSWFPLTRSSDTWICMRGKYKA